MISDYNKIYFSFLIICSIATKCIAQSAYFEILYSNISLAEVIEDLEKNHQLLFSYKDQDIDNINIACEVKTDNLNILIQEILEDSNLDFEIVDNNFIILKNNIKDYKICGNVFDELSQVPLPYASIIINKTTKGTSTDSLGNFGFMHTSKENQSVIVSYVGYEKKEFPITSFNNNCIDIPLSISEQNVPYLVIKDYITDGITLDNNGSSTSIRLQRVGLLAGQTDTDVLKTLQFLPGINAPSSKASDTYIRGGTPDQNLIIWEDIPLYHTAHYFGMISAINPNIVKNIEVYRGGFGAEYGGKIAGVIDIKADDEKDKKPYIGISSNFINNAIYGKQYVDKKKKTAFIFSIRRSYDELFTTPTILNISRFNQQGFIVGDRDLLELPDNIKVNSDFSFLDGNIKLSSRINKKNRIDFSGLFVQNNFDDLILDNNRMESQRDTFELSNIGASVNWEYNWSNRIKSKLKLINTTYNYDYNYVIQSEPQHTVSLSGVKKNEITDQQVSYITDYKTKKNMNFSLGYHFTNYDIKYKISQTNKNQNELDDDAESEANLHALFIKYDNPINNILGINLGLRSSYYNSDKKFYLEPRVRLAKAINDNFSLSFNYGRHFQFASQVIEFKGSETGLSLPLWALTSRSIPVQKADLFQLGTIFEKNNWLIDLQMYHRKTNGISSRVYDFDFIEGGESEIGNAITNGIDVLVKKRFWKVRSWIAYSYSYSKLSFKRIRFKEFPVDHDQRHVLQWSNQIKINRFQLAISYKFSTGLPYSFANNFEQEMNQNDFELIYEGINNYRLKNIHEVNFSAQYQLNKSDKKWKAYLLFSITNLLNRNNIFNRVYYVDSTANQTPHIEFRQKANMVFTPNVSLNFEF